jgi:hypothetical protein
MTDLGSELVKAADIYQKSLLSADESECGRSLLLKLKETTTNLLEPFNARSHDELAFYKYAHALFAGNYNMCD